MRPVRAIHSYRKVLFTEITAWAVHDLAVYHLNVPGSTIPGGIFQLCRSYPEITIDDVRMPLAIQSQSVIFANPSPVLNSLGLPSLPVPGSAR